jgi:hypothetical protein
MPMRNELAMPRRYSSKATALDSLLSVLAFSLTGLVASLYFAAYLGGLDQLPLLVIEYNLG